MSGSDAIAVALPPPGAIFASVPLPVSPTNSSPCPSNANPCGLLLTQRECLLSRLYSETREISSATVIHGAMNRLLKIVGDEMRKAGVFDDLMGKSQTRSKARRPAPPGK